MLSLGFPKESAAGAADIAEWCNKGFFTPLEEEWICAGTFKNVVGRDPKATEEWFRNRFQALSNKEV